MSANNGVVRIGSKGRKKFVIGDEGDPRKMPVFEVDVVVAFQQWMIIDDEFRQINSNDEGKDAGRLIALADVPAWHAAAVSFVQGLGGGDVTTSEALDFLARLREEYDSLADFFRPRSLDERASRDTSEVVSGPRFSVET